MKELAQCKVEDPDFKFVAWRPRMRTRKYWFQPQKVLKKMPAILKEMETDISETEEIDVEHQEEVEEIVEEDEEELVEEDEASKTKPSRIKGLISGGGRDGVGKSAQLVM